MRLTLEEFKTLWNLVKSKQNPESLFIFSKLFMENAFHFCTTPTDHVLLREKPVETKPPAATKPMDEIPESEMNESLAIIDTCIHTGLDVVGDMV